MAGEVFGLITARGGSKRLPGKHLRCVRGVPLLKICIDQALKARNLAAVILSTDDPELAESGRAWGAEVPFLRPPELSSDHAKVVDVVLHAAEICGREQQTVCLLQPTSPFRTAGHIDAAVARLRESPTALSVISVKRAGIEKSWLKEMDSAGILQPIAPFDPGKVYRGEGPTLYQLNGALYVMPIPALRERQTFQTDRTLGFEMSAEESVDIDAQMDLDLAEVIAQRRANHDKP